MKKLQNTAGLVLVLACVGMLACTVRDVTEDKNCCKAEPKATGGSGAVAGSWGIGATAGSFNPLTNGGMAGGSNSGTVGGEVAGVGGSSDLGAAGGSGDPGAAGTTAMGYCTLGVSQLGSCMLK